MRFIICGAIAVFLPALILNILLITGRFYFAQYFIGAVCYVLHLYFHISYLITRVNMKTSFYYQVSL
ncbi:undecaprenyl-galactosyl transferase [Actinobacillus equuli]|nr:undecaprenyl-galactosyl transferase [Actinobacillus equuli]